MRDGELKTHLGYQTPDGWYETTLTPVSGQADKARHLVKGPATVWIKRHILWGAGSCVSGTPMGPWDLPDCPVVDGGLYYHSAGAYLMSGVHTVTIKPAAVRLQLAATPKVVIGDSATFHASTSDGTQFEITDWIWRTNAGQVLSSPGTCQPAVNPCKYAPQDSGTMYVRARMLIANPPPVEQAEARCAVLPCRAAGDTLINNPILRDALHDAMKASYPDAAELLNRIERSGTVVRHRQTGQLAVHRNDSLPADNCKSTQGVEVDLNEWDIIAIFHTHPFNMLQNVPHCGTTTAHDTLPGRVSVPGASDPDEATLKSINTELAHRGRPGASMYIIDKQFVYKYDPQGNLTQWRHGAGGTCDWWPDI